MDILQAINCDWKIISLIASENTTDGDIPSSTEKGLSLLKHLSRPGVLNIWKQTELLLTCMIQTLEQKAEGHLSNIVSIVSSKATQVMSLLYWKKKKLLINQEVSPLPEDNIRLLCPTFCVSQNFKFPLDFLWWT